MKIDHDESKAELPDALSADRIPQEKIEQPREQERRGFVVTEQKPRAHQQQGVNHDCGQPPPQVSFRVGRDETTWDPCKQRMVNHRKDSRAESEQTWWQGSAVL